MAYQFIGGVFAHAPALWLRYVAHGQLLQAVAGRLGPHGIILGVSLDSGLLSYGDNNRTQMIRTAGPGHLEDRTMSAACNPYLSFAAYVTAGLDGIRRKLDPGEPNLGNLYSLGMEEIQRRGIRLLPQSLAEALAELRCDELVQGSLGVIYDEFVSLKEAEWREYHRQVSQWELDRYLTLF